jgi:hypothetical protein
MRNDIPRGAPQEIAGLKLGDVLYNFDGNRRTYDKPGFGGAPVYEKHFRAEEIVGETSVSWIVGPGKVKVNKKTLESRTEFADRGYFTKTGMENDIWLHSHRYKISREAERASVEQLKEIARILGYNAAA